MYNANVIHDKELLVGLFGALFLQVMNLTKTTLLIVFRSIV